MIQNHRFPRNCTFWNCDWRLFRRIMVFSAVWFALTGTDTASWLVGGPAVLLASLLSRRLAPSSQYRISLTGMLRFIIFFQYQSLRGGLDVMGRALSWQQRLDPGLLTYTTFLPEGSARIFLVNTISLLPGTLSTDLMGEQIIVHTLDQTMPTAANIHRLEQHIAGLMNLPTPISTKSLL